MLITLGVIGGVTVRASDLQASGHGFDSSRSAIKLLRSTQPSIPTPVLSPAQDMFFFGKATHKHNRHKLFCTWGALQRGPGGPWPTQNFGWVGHNAFGPTNNWPLCSLVKLV